MRLKPSNTNQSGGGKKGGGGGGGKGQAKPQKKPRNRATDTVKAVLRGFSCCFGWNGKDGNRCKNTVVPGQVGCCQGRTAQFIHACNYWFQATGKYCLSTEHGAGHISHAPTG